MNTSFCPIENETRRKPFAIEGIPGISMIGEIGVGVAIVDPEGRFVTANQSLLAMLGYSESELRNLEFNRLIDSEELITGPGFIKKGGPLEKGERYQAEVRFIRKDSHTLWVRLTISRLTEEAFREDFFIVTVEDITKGKQAEEAVEVLKSQKLESFGILAGRIAHDFNNILAGILANVQLTQLSYQKGRDISKSLARTEEAVKRAAELIKELGAFSKSGSPMEE